MRLADALMQTGHTVNSVGLETEKPVIKARAATTQDISFLDLPDAGDYDLVLLGGPVWAFGPSPVIMAAIAQIQGLLGKQALPFATMGFPFKCLGGNAALKSMSRELATKGAQVMPGKVCSHILRNLEREIELAVEEIVLGVMD